ncbi:MAG TPA: TadG family pilus assembly protein [Dehalococcoidia bacterium]|nr:TadG family pilus assembly protein [Dehalococcoidia bacterium]
MLSDRCFVRGLLLGTHRDERGQIVFTFFPLLIGFFIIGALAWDAGVWYFDHRTAQNQVDAASLAAVQELPSDDTTDAETAAKDWLKRNGVADSAADAIQVQHHDEVDITSYCTQPELQPGEARVVFGAKADDGYHRVRVCLRRESLVLFSGLAGITNAIVSAGGTANLTEQPVRYALMAMDPTACQTLSLSGSPGGGGGSQPLIVKIGGDGSTYTHSTGSCANGTLSASGQAHLCTNVPEGAVDCSTAEPCPSGDPNLCGVHEHRSSWRATGGSSITPTPNFRSSPMPDPFKNIFDEGILPPPESSQSCAPQSPLPNPLPPGKYCDPVSPDGDELHLSGGNYVFMRGLSLQNNESIITDAPALIYITCAAALAGTGSCSSSANFSVQSDGGSNADGISVCIHGKITGPGTSDCPFDSDALDAEDVSCLPLELECLAIVIDPNWGDGNCISLSGQGSFQIFGNIYAISCVVSMSGGAAQTNQLNTTLVANEIDFSGQSNYDVLWNASTAPKELIIALVE